jgi:mannose-6-phosphate isomerase-like protein (cupin superfamily)
VLEHGTLSVEIYAPSGNDPQQPHSRDEVYAVISGRGEFVLGPERRPFGPGDVLFVPARASHRFEKFSDDFATWVFFYGPEGGEAGQDG